jgi:hypothetical protein
LVFWLAGPVADAAGGLAAIPLASALWRLDGWFTAKHKSAPA